MPDPDAGKSAGRETEPDSVAGKSAGSQTIAKHRPRPPSTVKKARHSSYLALNELRSYRPRRPAPRLRIPASPRQHSHKFREVVTMGIYQFIDHGNRVIDRQLG